MTNTIEKREIVMCVILTIVTCGIYGFVWYYKMTNDAAKLTNDTEFSGGKAVLFSIITCGIYNIYWAYKIGDKIKQAKSSAGLSTDDYSTLYLILAICTYFTGISGLIMYCLAQNELNSLAGN